MNLATKEFIRLHENDDIFTLKLKCGKPTDVDVELALRQIVGKQKIKHKVPTFYAKNEILYPPTLSLEQSSSESTAKYKSELCEGDKFVDLTGGFGIDCYFLSQRFISATYVEKQEELCLLARHNFQVLNQSNIEVINADTEDFLPQLEYVDWIYIDPARRNHEGKKVVFLSDCEPDISELAPVLLAKANQVMVKLSPMMDISAVLKKLPNISEIHIISVENECKELLLILNQGNVTNPLVNTINLCKNNRIEKFEFKLNDENEATASYCNEVQQYLFEPNASLMKSGAFKLLSNIFCIYKISINTHLYTSSKVLLEFPGRIFEIKKIWGNSKQELKELRAMVPKANISTRNYPLSADELRKKLKIKDGGDIFLFACTLHDGLKSIIECTKHR